MVSIAKMIPNQSNTWSSNLDLMGNHNFCKYMCFEIWNILIIPSSFTNAPEFLLLSVNWSSITGQNIPDNAHRCNIDDVVHRWRRLSMYNVGDKKYTIRIGRQFQYIKIVTNIDALFTSQNTKNKLLYDLYYIYILFIIL